jgi:preprotein translocase subunit Sec63
MNSLKQQIKKAKKHPVMKEAKYIDYDKDGRAQIFVGLRESDEFFSPYSYLTYELMNEQVASYIDTCESGIPLSDEITIDIHTEEPTTNEEKQRIRKAVKRHNAEKVVILKEKLRRKTAFGLGWLIFGLTLLFMEIIFHLSDYRAIGMLIDVAGWVFAWDGLEILITDRRTVKRQIVRCYRLINAKVHVKKYSQKIQRDYGIGDYYEEDDE